MKIKIKWNKQNYDDIEFEPADGLIQLKSILFSLTQVPVDRQKILAKGKTLKEDSDASIIKEGMQLMLMGTADVLEGPKQNITFLEDMTAEQKMEKNAVIPAGLVNLGNTCYMNSTLQCMRHMSELRTALQAVPFRHGTDSPSNLFALSVREMWNSLDRAEKTFTPLQFVTILRSNFPQFAQQGPRGGYMQQDAEELYNVTTQSISGMLSEQFDSILGLRVEETLSCAEAETEPVVMKLVKTNKLICNIQGGPGSNIAINHLVEGLKLGLEGTVEKHSEVLGRNALWSKRQRLASLPQFLCVQFMRFFWKPTPDSRDHAGVKCKILRPVAYTETLDVFEFANENLQALLRDNRERVKRREDAVLAASTSSKTPDQTPAAAAEEGKMDVDEDEDEAALRAALALSVAPAGDGSALAAPPSVPGDSSPNPLLPSPDFTGIYELFAVVTHKGRSADSGHYIGWVRQSPGAEHWWRYDDETVTEVRSSEILELKGGGDWHTAYLSFYRFKA